jgi:uncharacterized metal-binding protein YceD (DUF177 family)
VKYAREFILPIAGLAPGKTNFTFNLGRPFFALVDDDEVINGKVNVELQLDKRENMIELHFTINGWLEVPCDRCADEFHQPIEGNQILILKYGERYEEETDEIIIIPADHHEFDISKLLYEYIILLLPIRKVHPDDNNGNTLCNKEVLSKLEQLRIETESDPRWEALKKINFQS